MGSVRQYILSIVVAAFVCCIVKSIVGNKSGHGKIVSIICGVFLTVVVLSPVLDLKIPDLMTFTDDFKNDAENIVSFTQDETQTQLRTIIKEKTESYILDKAASMNSDIRVEVILDDVTSIPIAAIIHGDVSPYNKAILSQYLVDSLGISEESQTWNLAQ